MNIGTLMTSHPSKLAMAFEVRTFLRRGHGGFQRLRHGTLTTTLGLQDFGHSSTQCSGVVSPSDFTQATMLIKV